MHLIESIHLILLWFRILPLVTLALYLISILVLWCFVCYGQYG